MAGLFSNVFGSSTSETDDPAEDRDFQNDAVQAQQADDGQMQSQDAEVDGPGGLEGARVQPPSEQPVTELNDSLE